MSYPDALELATALEKKTATPEQIITAAQRLRQFYQLCRSFEGTIEDGRITVQALNNTLNQKETALAQEKSNARQFKEAYESLLPEYNNVVAQAQVAEAGFQTALKAKHDEFQTFITSLEQQKNAVIQQALAEKEAVVVQKNGEMSVMRDAQIALQMELKGIKEKPEVIAVLDELKQQEIAALEARLAILKPVEKELVKDEGAIPALPPQG